MGVKNFLDELNKYIEKFDLDDEDKEEEISHEENDKKQNFRKSSTF